MNTQEKQYDVIVAGEINPDLILSDPNLMPRFGQHEILIEDAVLTIGSSSAIYSCGAAILGLRVAFIGVVGDDEFGHYMLKSLEQKNVDISPVIIDSELKTGFSVILNRGEDRSIITFLGAIDALRADQISNELLNECRHLHVASYFIQNGLRPGLPDLFGRAKDLGLSISLDTNWDPEEKWQGLDELLPKVDIFMPNKNELLSITKQQNIDKALQDITRVVPFVAAKLGEQGAIAFDGEIIQKARPPVIEKIFDTVGAGDTFDAGFTYGFLNGWDLEKTLRLAVTCGSLSLRQHGGTAAQPTLDEAMTIAGL
jgi:sugar/nucleoside kinase (ribokinase family)